MGMHSIFFFITMFLQVWVVQMDQAVQESLDAARRSLAAAGGKIPQMGEDSRAANDVGYRCFEI